MTEPKLRTIVATGQWSSSWLIVVALLAVMLHIAVPEWLTSLAEIAFIATFPAFLVLGMILVVRLPDRRKIAGLLVNAFIILAGMGLMSYMVDRDRASGAQATLDRIHASAEWLNVEAALKSARSVNESLSMKLLGLPPDYVAATERLTTLIAAKDIEITQLSAAESKLEHAAPTENIVVGAVAFDIFGAQNSGWVETIMLLIIAGGNEAIALVLMWGAAGAQTVRESARIPAQSGETAEERAVREESTYTRAEAHLKAQGQRGGYRAVAELMKIPEGRARAIMERRDKRSATTENLQNKAIDKP